MQLCDTEYNRKTNLIMTSIITLIAMCDAKYDILVSLAMERKCLNANASPYGKNKYPRKLSDGKVDLHLIWLWLYLVWGVRYY